MQYLTYTQDGQFTGAFIQDLQPGHEAIHIEVNDEVYRNWTAYRLVGGVPTIAPPAPLAQLVPQSVTRFQAKAALDEAGHLDAIEAIIANPDTPRLYVLAWQDALTFERDSQTLAALAGMLQLTDADLDALFIRAAEIKS